MKTIGIYKNTEADYLHMIVSLSQKHTLLSCAFLLTALDM